ENFSAMEGDWPYVVGRIARCAFVRRLLCSPTRPPLFDQTRDFRHKLPWNHHHGLTRLRKGCLIFQFGLILALSFVMIRHSPDSGLTPASGILLFCHRR